MLKNIINDEHPVRRSVKVRRRLKSLIRLAYFNRHWLEVYESEDIGTSVYKNIRVITGKKSTDSLISIQQKATLNKRKEERSEAEKRYLSVVLGGMRCFKRYPAETRKQLAAVARFYYFPPGRYILREGDAAFGWYYILAGKVSIRRKKHTIDGEREKEIRVFIKGYTFGEYSLLHNIRRHHSSLTLSHCEFLTIEKSDFDVIMRKTVLRHYDIITNYVLQLPYFEFCDQKDIIDVCLVAKVKEFEHDEIVLGDDVGYSQYAYFIIKGKLKIIHHLMFTVHWNKTLKRDEYKLYDPFSDPNNEYFTKKSDILYETGVEALDTEYGTQEFPWETPPPNYFQLQMVNSLPQNIHTCFIKIYTMNESGCFNVGENLEHRFVIAETSSNCICLLLPRYWIYKRNTAYIWSRLVEHFNLTIPNAQSILNQYTKKRQWELKKRKLTKNILTGSNLLNSNTMNNVPISIRLKEDLSLYKDAYSTYSEVTEVTHR